MKSTIHSTLSLIASIAVLWFWHPAHAADEPGTVHAPAPAPFSARYEVRTRGLAVGVMERRLSQMSADEFRFESVTTTVGIARLLYRDVIREITHWRSGDVAPEMLDYEYHQVGSKDRHVKIMFDYASGTIRNVVNGNSWSMELEPGVVDKLVYQVLVMRDLAAGIRDLSYRIADGGRIKTYVFQAQGTELQTTPAGSFQAVILQRFRPGDDRDTTIWCAEQLGFLPIRVDQVDADGSLVTIRLQSYDPAVAVAPATED